MKKSTIILTLKNRIKEADEMACALTELTPHQLNKIRFETAYEYLEKIIGTDNFGMEAIPKTGLFWGWWSREWLRIDEMLFMEYNGNKPLIRWDFILKTFYIKDYGVAEVNVSSAAQFREVYLKYHAAKPENYHLNSVVIDETWHQMIKNLANIKR